MTKEKCNRMEWLGSNVDSKSDKVPRKEVIKIIKQKVLTENNRGSDNEGNESKTNDSSQL